MVFVSELGPPTSVDAVSSEPAHMVAAFAGGHVALFNMETQQRVLTMESAGPPGERWGGEEEGEELMMASVLCRGSDQQSAESSHAARHHDGPGGPPHPLLRQQHR